MNPPKNPVDAPSPAGLGVGFVLACEARSRPAQSQALVLGG